MHSAAGRPEHRALRRNRVAAAALLAAMVAGSAVRVAAADGEPIPMSPLTDLTSLSASVQLDVDGTIDGKPTTGTSTRSSRRPTRARAGST